HQGADRILCRAQRRERPELEALALGVALQLLAQVALLLGVVAGQRGNEVRVAVLGELLERAGPGWAVRPAVACAFLLTEAWEEQARIVAARSGILLVGGLHLLQVGGVCALEERRARECFVLRLP